MNFVHLHNHTEYSLLDGGNRIKDMVSKAKDFGMPALAISDHGVMFGAVEFYMECNKVGIKPIIGMEAYVAPKGLRNKSIREENQINHLLLLAKNIDGYRNLCKLHTIAAMEGFYYKPRIDHELLREHAKGLISSSTCLGSEICQELMKGDYKKAQYIAGMYKEIFEEGSYFIELQDHHLKEQHQIKESLIKISKELKLPLIATNDAHYLGREDAKSHDVLLCIGTGSQVADQKRLRFETEEFYIKSQEEMFELFKETPEALENTLLIADMCHLELGQQRALMPDPELPAGETSISYLRQLAEAGVKAKMGNPNEEILQRLNYELNVIEKTGFENYFLLVREFAQFTRNQEIMFGVRGSAAGSLVSYSIGITDIDPIEYDITFERFLNIERIAMPDIDMDFEDARRDEVIKWVTEKYGQDRVAQIITFGTLGAKAAIRDSGRVMGYAPIETDKICKTIPNMPGMTLEKALKESAEFRHMVQKDPKVNALVEIAKSVEGLSRHAGVHAAGVVISKDPLSEHIPLYRSNEGLPVTAFEMGILEKIGLLKMDFLGLSNLTVLAKTLQNIKLTQGKDIHLKNIPLDDPKSYEMLGKGETVGVFQLESGGMRRNIIELKPQSIIELAAMIALYRPGPMEHIPKYIDNKFGRSKPEYLDEKMRPILEDTYGVIVFQDQVLKLVQALAGFTLGKADILRRAMGKKDIKAMQSIKIEFFEGAKKNGISTEACDKIWELLLPFAGYAFNKAHAISYAFLAYQTAYLKANYPVEYMAGLLGVYRSKEDRVAACIDECRHQKIKLLPPNINQSSIDFLIEKKSIRFGLGAIKGIGDGLVHAILKEKEENGKFTHLFEFCERTKPFGINRTAVEALIKAGALSDIHKNRQALLSMVDAALAFADTAYKNKKAGQSSLFEESKHTSEIMHYPELPEADPLTRSELLHYEKEVLGIYVSDHPLRGYEKHLLQITSHPCSAISECEEGTKVTIAGVIANLRTLITKSKGEKMATLVLEDFTGHAALTLFPAIYAKFAELIYKDNVVKIKGIVTHREKPGAGKEKSIEIRTLEVSPLEAPEAIFSGSQDKNLEGTVVITVPKATKVQLTELKEILEKNPGNYSVLIQLGEEESIIPIEPVHRTCATQEFLECIKSLIPEGKVETIEVQI